MTIAPTPSSTRTMIGNLLCVTCGGQRYEVEVVLIPSVVGFTTRRTSESHPRAHHVSSRHEGSISKMSRDVSQRPKLLVG